MAENFTSGVARQYASSNPLAVRVRTHQLYGERQIDLDEVCYAALELTGHEALLDAGCGPGGFLTYIRDQGHTGRLTGLDQSTAMVENVEALGIEAVLGDVQSLPFADTTFDCVVARHMLYHVPDIPQALHEFRRVLKPDGRLLVTTNSERSMPHITSLLQEMLAAFGYPEWARPDNRFCIENAEDFFTGAGFQVDGRVIENALVFDAPEPPVAYCVSCLPSLDIPQDDALYAEQEAWLLAAATQRLADLGGKWRDPTFAGIYVCTAEA